jgi:hypothetical protein
MCCHPCFVGSVPARHLAPAGRVELIARAAPRSRLRFGGKVLRLRDHHRDVEAAFGLAAAGDGRAVCSDDRPGDGQARELETGTFRYTWTLGVGRRRWALAKLAPLTVAATAAHRGVQPAVLLVLPAVLRRRQQYSARPRLFDLHGVAFAAWTLAALAIGALMGLLIRRVVPAIAATLAAVAGLLFAARLYLQQHYIAPLIARKPFTPPASAWIINGWWTKGGTAISQPAMNQIMITMFRQILPAILPKNVNDDDIKFYKGAANSQVLHYLTHHGYTQWTSYQPGSRFWPFQWIEGGWLVALSVLLIAATVWLVGRRAT